MHYFAYSNLLDIDYMRRFCPSAEAVGVMRLDGYELSFAKCANPEKAGSTLRPTPGAATWGVQYRMSAKDKTKLDEVSGVPNGDWAPMPVTVHTRDGRAVETTTFIIPRPSGPHVPPDSYVAPMFKGAADFDLPASYRARLRELVDAAKGLS